MRHNIPITPLLAILRALETDERRDEFAELSGTKRAYLYQLGICNRKSCRASLAKQIADASVKMAEKYGTPVITLDVMACMCSPDVLKANRDLGL